MSLIPVNGVRLEVRTLPATHRPEAAPIVFLHEGLGSVAMWQSREGYWPEQVCQATGRAGLVYSRQGYGQSDPVPDVRGTPREVDGQRHGRLRPDYLHREAWAVLPALLAAQGLQAPVLLGHSDGGSIALLHASRHPVASCIVMAPHTMVEEVSLASILEARTAFERGGLRERLARYHADVDGAFWQWNEVWLSPAFRDFDIRAECRQIRSPVLALQGVDDAYGTLAQIEGIAPAQAPVTRHALADCGHSPHRDQPARTLALIAEHLAGRP